MAKMPSSSFICTSAGHRFLGRAYRPIVMEPSLPRARSASPPLCRSAPETSRGSAPRPLGPLVLLGHLRISPCHRARALPAFPPQPADSHGLLTLVSFKSLHDTDDGTSSSADADRRCLSRKSGEFDWADCKAQDQAPLLSPNSNATSDTSSSNAAGESLHTGLLPRHLPPSLLNIPAHSAG